MPNNNTDKKPARRYETPEAPAKEEEKKESE